ncbi:MAG TPA: oligosaccharide flippase family protein [Polyangiaceae bacterium]|jgi:O-antigen/teichoic acid export membrane protein
MTTPVSGELRPAATRREPLSRDGASDTLAAVTNALKLGSSLIATLGIAIATKLLMPRYLGPTSFGTLSFADGFTATFFVALNLGAEFYIRKEVSVRPAHASDFLGGTLLLRAVMSAAIFGVMTLVMRATGRSPEVQALVYVFGAAQFFVSVNATFSALLHAKGAVGGMSALAVATKIVWAGGVVVSIVAGVGLWGFAVAYLASESIESFILYGLARRHLGLVLRVDPAATRAMVVSSLPYFLNVCATGAYGRVDVPLLGILAGAGREVGWYVAASTLSGLTLLVTPLIDWVLTPVLARGALRSREDLFSHVRQATEPILVVAIPVSLFVAVGADLWLRLLFGRAFDPATTAVRILAGSSVVIYVAIVYALTLIMLERAWTLTLISVGGLLLNVVLNLLLIRPCLAAFGDGGGGVGCALAALGTHLFAAGAMIAFVGHKAFDASTYGMIAKSLLGCVLVVLVDRLGVSLGWLRLVPDVAVYLVVVLATGALRTKAMWQMVTEAVRSRRRSRA